jgi:hypothetical protein
MTVLAELRHNVDDAQAPSNGATIADLSLADTPTNQQIMNAAKAAYASYQPAADALTLALINTEKDPSMADAMARLDATNWTSPGITSAVVEPFFSGHDLATAIGAIRTTDLKSVSVGAFTKTLPVGSGDPGMIGFARDVLGVTDRGVTLDLDIFRSIVSVDNLHNLQYGAWTEAPGDLHDTVIGFYANATVQGESINLKILLTTTLKPYGFVVSAGAAVPVASGIFAGTTALWTA